MLLVKVPDEEGGGGHRIVAKLADFGLHMVGVPDIVFSMWLTLKPKSE